MSALYETDVTPGQLLAGKFRIERILGRGGMGVVVLATHIHLEEQVAIKFLLPEALTNAEAVRRFEREARAAVKIKSEHVARVTDVGTLDNGAPYMVMEYLKGLDLGQYLEEKGPLPVEEAVEYLLQASEAIAEAHSLGIVHRDLKPANLFRIVRADGTPSIKVLDFGISKLTGGTESSMTQTSSMMGSPFYMSPEQMTSSKNVDARSDIWAMGVILFELVTGHVPYPGETIPEIVAQVLQATPPSVLKYREELPAGMDEVLRKTLEKNREHRFPDVAAFALALSAYAPAQARASIQRVSRVLGVSNEETLPDGGKPRRANTAPVRSFGPEDPTHTQLNAEANIPTHPTGKWVALGAAALALLGAAVFAWTASPSTVGPDDPGAEGSTVIVPASAVPSTTELPRLDQKAHITPPPASKLPSGNGEPDSKEQQKVETPSSSGAVVPAAPKAPPPAKASTGSDSRTNPPKAPQAARTEPVKAQPQQTAAPKTEPPKAEPPKASPPKATPSSDLFSDRK